MANATTFRRGIAPKASDTDINHMVWSCSSFPFCKDIRKIRRSLRRYFRLGGNSVEGAVNVAHEELDKEMILWRENRQENNL